MPKLTWEELDKCDSVAEIVALLEKHEIKGNPVRTYSCPLAVATGWAVSNTQRWEIDNPTLYGLTIPEKEFVSEFDDGKYAQLQEKPEL